MKKKRMIMKILKRNDLYENFEKRGGSREKGEEETKSMPHAPVAKSTNLHVYSWFSFMYNYLLFCH